MTRHLSRPLTAVVGALLALGFLLASAVPAAACSCIAPQPMSAYAGDPAQVIFTGVVMAPDGRGVPVQVTHWFQGADAAPIVWLDDSSFDENGASCGTARPPAGAEWIFVAWKSEGQDLGVNLCSPHAAASDPTGQAMFKDAVATFGEGVVPGEEPSVDPSGSVETTTSGASSQLPLALGGAIFIAVVTATAILGVRRLRRPPGDDPPA